MAIEYFLLLRDNGRKLDRDEVHAALVSNFPLHGSGSSDMLLGKGLIISVSDEEPERAMEDGALYPGAILVFRIDKFSEHEAGVMGMLTVTEWILRAFPCDAELSFQLEEIVLSRRSGQLSLVADDSFWSSERRSIFKNQLESARG